MTARLPQLRLPAPEGRSVGANNVHPNPFAVNSPAGSLFERATAGAAQYAVCGGLHRRRMATNMQRDRVAPRARTGTEVMLADVRAFDRHAIDQPDSAPLQRALQTLRAMLARKGGSVTVEDDGHRWRPACAPRRATAAVMMALCVSPALAQPPQPIPHGGVAAGQRDIAAAWLAGPTRRYAHAVLGDDVEASELRIETRDGVQLSVRLGDDSVFEDLTPRLADIDSDGRDEVWTVRSDAAGGARLEAYGVIVGALVLRFATTPIGTGFRWLNPLGVADFDGDGRNEAAYVETPHIGGVLTIVRPEGGRLVVVARRRGHSNHAIGSTRLDLAAIADLDASGGADIVLPDQRRERLVVLSLVEGELVERWRSAPGPAVAGALELRMETGGWRARYSTPDGAVVTVAIPELQALR